MQGRRLGVHAEHFNAASTIAAASATKHILPNLVAGAAGCKKICHPPWAPTPLLLVLLQLHQLLLPTPPTPSHKR